MESLKYMNRSLEPDEVESVEHCAKSDFKYYILYITGHDFSFKNLSYIYRDNAVSI